MSGDVLGGALSWAALPPAVVPTPPPSAFRACCLIQLWAPPRARSHPCRSPLPGALLPCLLLCSTLLCPPAPESVAASVLSVPLLRADSRFAALSCDGVLWVPGMPARAVVGVPGGARSGACRFRVASLISRLGVRYCLLSRLFAFPLPRGCSRGGLSHSCVWCLRRAANRLDGWTRRPVDLRQ